MHINNKVCALSILAGMLAIVGLARMTSDTALNKGVVETVKRDDNIVISNVSTKTDAVDKQEFILNSSEIMKLVQKYDLNNYGTSEAQVVVERLQFNSNGATNKTSRGNIYKRTSTNFGISSVDMYTDYTMKDGYDTHVYVDFVGDVKDNDFTHDVVASIIEEDAVAKDVVNRILNEESFTYNIQLGAYGAQLRCKHRGGSHGYRLEVESNSGVLVENKFRASKLAEVEQLLNPEAIKEVENYTAVNPELAEKLLDLEVNLNGHNGERLTDTVVERAWVRDFDREKNEELNEFKRYYVEKEYNLTDNDNNKYKIVMHVDDFDRYNIGRKAWVGSLGTSSKEVLASALESLSVDLNDCVFRDDYGKNFKSFILTK